MTRIGCYNVKILTGVLSKLVMEISPRNLFSGGFSLQTIKCLVILNFFLGATSCSVNSSKIKPNIVIILTDDQGWGDVGFNGNRIIETPHIDSLASQSVVFSRFYASPACAATRASLLTGKYNLATGVSWETHRKEVMRDSEITLAEVLKLNGYRTACFGKWGNGLQFPHNAIGQGFDEFFGFNAGHWNNYFNAKLEYNNKLVETEGYITDVITDSVVAFIQKANQPFLAYVAYNTPHTPYQVPDQYYQKYLEKGLDAKTASIYGMCENIDENILKIQNTLKGTQKHSNTIFIYMSDNGPNYVRYNGGYKGRKALVDEGGVRVPFLINYPNGNFQERAIDADFAAHIDIMPTLLELLGANIGTIKMDGNSFVSILIDSTKHLKDRLFFTHQAFDDEQFAGAVRTNDYLLTCYAYDTCLYNLSQDPFQMSNILDAERATADSLKSEFKSWLKEFEHLNNNIEPIQLGHAEASRVELPAYEGKLGNHVTYAGGDGWANDWAVNWTSKNDFLEWPLKIIKAGHYKAKIYYVASQSSVGSNFSLECQNNALDFIIEEAFKKEIVKNNDRFKRAEVDEIIWGEATIGVLNLIKGESKISLVYKNEQPSDIEIKGLELVYE